MPDHPKAYYHAYLRDVEIAVGMWKIARAKGCCVSRAYMFQLMEETMFFQLDPPIGMA